MKTLIYVKAMTAGVLASLLMAGTALAMDSVVVEERMEEISEQTSTSDKPRVEALEAQVEELEALIRMMLEERHDS
ncbi:hypothetical protein [Halomonas salinarum]|uniref:hypothetical protein n=1 Tax=Halomonas salinarum TaxID=1158993 RepID=UPI001439ED2A|nr:hypothetical protein [Halomonas salinarum]